MREVLVYKESLEVTTILDQLGLDVDDLQKAVKANFLAQANCTEHDAPTAPGFVGWNAAVRTLRELLSPKGWMCINIKNSPRIINLKKDVEIMVATGDEATGNPYAMPKTKSRKGVTTRASVNNNEMQISLFSEETIPHMIPAASMGQLGKPTWALLIYIHIDQSDNQQHSIRAELSLPVGMDNLGHITTWSERIILPEIPIGWDDSNEETEKYAPEQEIILERK